MIKRSLFTITFLIVLTACLKDKTAEPVIEPVGPCADTVSFQDEIFPEIFEPTCASVYCHGDGGGSGGYILNSHDQISTNADMLLKVMQHDPTVTPMPAGGDKLADSLIQKFDCWIQQGKLDN